MCTAISDTQNMHLFGRTLDLEYSYGESTVLTPRAFELRFSELCAPREHLALLGTAHVCDGVPLYYDAVNESGLAAAALNFPLEAVYNPPRVGAHNVASFELIPWILSQCEDLRDAVRLLQNANVTDKSFSPAMPATPLHWLIADKSGCIAVEPTERGLEVHNDPFGVLTNSPRFSRHVSNLARYAHCSPSAPKNNICPQADISCFPRGTGAVGLPGDLSSESRFIRAVFCKSHTVNESDVAAQISRFFHVMDAVAQPRGCALSERGEPIKTVYTSCIDTCAQVYYYTTYSCRAIHALSMRAHDLDGRELTVFERSHKESFSFL